MTQNGSFEFSEISKNHVYLRGSSTAVGQRCRVNQNQPMKGMEASAAFWNPLRGKLIPSWVLLSGADLWYKIVLVTLVLEEVIACVLSSWLIKSMLCAILGNFGTETWIFSAWWAYIKAFVCRQCTKSHSPTFHFYLFIRVKGEWKCVIILTWAVAVIHNLNLKCFTFSV